MPTVNDTLRQTTDRHTTDRQAPLASSPRKMVVFYLATQPYGLDLEDVQEILPLAELSRPPLCPNVLAGFLNIGSEPTPVIRLSRLFDVPDQPPELYTPLLLLRSSSGRLAVLVDRVSEIVTLSDDCWAPVCNGHSLNDCV
ncbi:MAG TPA: chemotaxis protein CheW, partial [Pirellulales bacterium]|nr:chemotaxis protein CheW [Pirellulales bacterium]